MATAKQPLGAPGGLPTPESVATFTYGQLVAVQCQVNDRLIEAAGVNYTDVWCSMQPLYWAMTLRLEQLGEDDPRVVRAVAAALARPHAGRRVRDDITRAESDLALHAHRSAMRLIKDGTHRGPFADL